MWEFLIIKRVFKCFNQEASRVNILDYVTLVSISSSFSNSWFKLIWLQQRRQIKLIQATFYLACLGMRILTLNNHFLLFPHWAGPLLVLICWFLIQRCELMSSLSNCVWEPCLLIYPEYASIIPPAFSIPLKILSKRTTWHWVNLRPDRTFWDWILV